MHRFSIPISLFVLTLASAASAQPVVSGHAGIAIPVGFDSVLGGMTSASPAFGIEGKYRFAKFFSFGLSADVFLGSAPNDTFWAFQPHVGLQVAMFFFDVGGGLLLSGLHGNIVPSVKATLGTSFGLGPVSILPRVDVLISGGGTSVLNPSLNAGVGALVTPGVGLAYEF